MSGPIILASLTSHGTLTRWGHEGAQVSGCYSGTQAHTHTHTHTHIRVRAEATFPRSCTCTNTHTHTHTHTPHAALISGKPSRRYPKLSLKALFFFPKNARTGRAKLPHLLVLWLTSPLGMIKLKNMSGETKWAPQMLLVRVQSEVVRGGHCKCPAPLLSPRFLVRVGREALLSVPFFK